MGKTEIGWTDVVWNPTIGCTRVSAGCEHCYAIRVAHRLEAFGQETYRDLTRTFPDGSVNWRGVVRTVPARLEEPLKWRKPRRVFVNSMSDLFHESVPGEFIDQVFAVMGACEDQERGHMFQVLTKRPERMREYMRGRAHEAWNRRRLGQEAFPPRNVWLGVSVEDQAAADARTQILLQTPAAVRFISAEPLLGPLNLQHVKMPNGFQSYNVLRGSVRGAHPDSLPQGGHPHIDWVIVGGESGPNHRPMDGRWAFSIRDQCEAAGVPFFFKQWGGRTPKAGGRVLGDRTYDEFPSVQEVVPA